MSGKPGRSTTRLPLMRITRIKTQVGSGSYPSVYEGLQKKIRRFRENREILFLSQSEHIMDITDILNS
jgi:hypothetical protein